MSKYVGVSFPSNASYGDDFFNTSQNLIYRFVGTNPLNPLHWVIYDGSVAIDPDTTGWGDMQKSARWYNYMDFQWKGWNGIQIVIIG